MMMKQFLLRLQLITSFCRDVYYQIESINGFQRASALAYTSLLSLVPLMTVSLAILSAFPAFNAISGHIQDFFFTNFIAAGAGIQSHLMNFTDKARHLSAIGVFFLVITAISTMLTIESTFNAIWHVEQRRSWLAAFMLYWTILTVSPLLIGVGFAVSSYLASFTFLNSTMQSLGVTQFFLGLVPFVLSVLAFTLMYMAVPNCRVMLRPAFIAALIAGAAFEGAKHLFAIYVTQFAGYELLYGALAAIPIFLLWVYLCWLITIFGAIISYIFTQNSAIATENAPQL